MGQISDLKDAGKIKRKLGDRWPGALRPCRIVINETATIPKDIWERLLRRNKTIAESLNKNLDKRKIREIRKKMASAIGVKPYMLFGTKKYPKRIQLADRVFQIMEHRFNHSSGVITKFDVASCDEDIVKLVQNNYRRRAR